MADETHTDVVEEHTDEVLDQDIPDEDEVEEKPKTRKEKTAEKAGKTVEELDEEKNLAKKLGRLDELEAKLAKLDHLDPLIKEAEQKAEKAEFEKGSHGISFEDYNAELTDLLSVGADPEKAKDLALKRAKAKAGVKEEEEREAGRDALSHPPTSNPDANIHKVQLVSRKKFETYMDDHGPVAYKKYCDYCDQNYEGKYFR